MESGGIFVLICILFIIFIAIFIEKDNEIKEENEKQLKRKEDEEKKLKEEEENEILKIANQLSNNQISFYSNSNLLDRQVYLFEADKINIDIYLKKFSNLKFTFLKLNKKFDKKIKSFEIEFIELDEFGDESFKVKKKINYNGDLYYFEKSFKTNYIIHSIKESHHRWDMVYNDSLTIEELEKELKEETFKQSVKLDTHNSIKLTRVLFENGEVLTFN